MLTLDLINLFFFFFFIQQQNKQNLLENIQRLHVKRIDENRPISLDEMTADELVLEKTAVQRGLLFLESLYGRPNTRDERDAARSLYNRYRLLKRMVTRSVTISGAGISNPSELPTILEHEAMAFTMNPGKWRIFFGSLSLSRFILVVFIVFLCCSAIL